MSALDPDHTLPAIVVMAKRPKAGHTKTRLIPRLTPQQAADLYQCFLLDMLAVLSERTDVVTYVAIDEPGSSDWFRTFAPETPQLLQIGATLGYRLDAVLSAALDLGHPKAFAIGSDLPDLPTAHLDAGLAALDADDVDVVLGPSGDGGYWLIGWKRAWTQMVTDVTMSTSTVLADTLRITHELGATVALAPEWDDIDTPSDLERLRSSGELSASTHTASFLAGLA